MSASNFNPIKDEYHPELLPNWADKVAKALKAAKLFGVLSLERKPDETEPLYYASIVSECIDQVQTRLDVYDVINVDVGAIEKFIKYCERYLSLIQLAEFFNPNNESYSEHWLINNLLPKLNAFIKMISFKEEQIPNLIILRRVKFLCLLTNKKYEEASDVAFQLVRDNISLGNLDTAEHFANCILKYVEKHKKLLPYMALGHEALADVAKQRWNDSGNYEVKYLVKAINHFYLNVQEKIKAGQLLAREDSCVHMFISLSLTRIDTDKLRDEEKLEIYSTLLDYAKMIKDDRKIAHIYKSMAEFYENSESKNLKESEKYYELAAEHACFHARKTGFLEISNKYSFMIRMQNPQISSYKDFLKSFDLVCKNYKKNKHRFFQANSHSTASGKLGLRRVDFKKNG